MIHVCIPLLVKSRDTNNCEVGYVHDGKPPWKKVSWGIVSLGCIYRDHSICRVVVDIVSRSTIIDTVLVLVISSGTNINTPGLGFTDY